jgi:hypothetical protein
MEEQSPSVAKAISPTRSDMYGLKPVPFKDCALLFLELWSTEFAVISVHQRGMEITVNGVCGQFRKSGSPGPCPGTFSAVPSGLVRDVKTYPGLTSWATLSRPCGTELWTDRFSRNLLSPTYSRSFTARLKPCPSSREASFLQRFSCCPEPAVGAVAGAKGPAITSYLDARKLTPNQRR